MMTWSYYSSSKFQFNKTIKTNEVCVIQSADETKAARGPALAQSLHLWAPHAKVTPGSPFCPNIQRAPPQGRFTLWGKTRLNNCLGPLEDILSQGHLEVWESIFLQRTAIDVFFKRLIDQMFPKHTSPLLWWKHSGFRRWENCMGNLNLSKILVQSNLEFT